jgi:hypothetical protein
MLIYKVQNPDATLSRHFITEIGELLRNSTFQILQLGAVPMADLQRMTVNHSYSPTPPHEHHAAH